MYTKLYACHAYMHGIHNKGLGIAMVGIISSNLSRYMAVYILLPTPHKW